MQGGISRLKRLYNKLEGLEEQWGGGDFVYKIGNLFGNV